MFDIIYHMFNLIKTFFSGRKTFIVGVLMIALGAMNGETQLILEGFGLIALRLGLAKTNSK